MTAAASPLGRGEAYAQAGSGVGWSLLKPASQYLPASQLDRRPAPNSEINPVPPKGSESRGGRVVARVLINESGKADRVIVESSEPRGLFDASVVAAFGTALYRPGYKSGVAVKSQMRVEVRIEPQDPSPAPARRP
jgi:TonB family protein